MAKYSNREKTQRITLSGLLIAMMLVLGYIEHLIPDLGIPGIKLGLSNGILIFAIYMLDLPTAWVLMVLKVVLTGLIISRNIAPVMYAFAGGVLSMAAMSLLSRPKDVHPITVSMAGGVMHNVGQVCMAMVMFKTDKLLYYMAVLVLVGAACGALTGACATSVMKHLKAMK